MFTNKSSKFCAISMNCLLHLKMENQMWKLDFPKFCPLYPKWCAIAGSSGEDSVCICTTHENTILSVDVLNWEVTYQDLANKIVCDQSNCECMMHRCPNCPGTNTLRKFLEEELSDIAPDFQIHYSQWYLLKWKTS